MTSWLYRCGSYKDKLEIELRREIKLLSIKERSFLYITHFVNESMFMH